MRITGWIDRTPTWARDLLLMLAVGGLSWGADTLVPYLQEQEGIVSRLVAPLLVVMILAVTKWTQAYGRGAGGGDSVAPAGATRAESDLADAQRAMLEFGRPPDDPRR